MGPPREHGGKFRDRCRENHLLVRPSMLENGRSRCTAGRRLLGPPIKIAKPNLDVHPGKPSEMAWDSVPIGTVNAGEEASSI
jgi:hypothetical protein